MYEISSMSGNVPVLASSPQQFRACGNLVRRSAPVHRFSCFVSSRAIRLPVLLRPCSIVWISPSPYYEIALPCGSPDADPQSRIIIRLGETRHDAALIRLRQKPMERIIQTSFARWFRPPLVPFQHALPKFALKEALVLQKVCHLDPQDLFVDHSLGAPTPKIIYFFVASIVAVLVFFVAIAYLGGNLWVFNPISVLLLHAAMELRCENAMDRQEYLLMFMQRLLFLTVWSVYTWMSIWMLLRFEIADHDSS